MNINTKFTKFFASLTLAAFTVGGLGLGAPAAQAQTTTGQSALFNVVELVLTADIDIAVKRALIVQLLSNYQIDMDDDDMDMMMNMSPEMMDVFAGASAVYLDRENDHLYVSSNTEGMVGVYDLDNGDDWMMFDVEATDADGIYYDEDEHMLYQINRSDNQVDVYMDIMDSVDNEDNDLMFSYSSSDDDFMNGREIAVMGDYVVVADDASDANMNQNRLFVYENDEDEEDLNLIREYDVDINLWGIKAVGNDLHAVIDNSNEVAMFVDFFDLENDDNELEPDMVFEVENLVRTHGLDYDMDTDTLVLTDVGSADSDSDGALVVIEGFMDAVSDMMISADEQTRIVGEDTMLGNPVDVSIDGDMIYVAERARDGGLVLTFQL